LAKAVITSYSFPTSAMANTQVSYTLSGHLEEQDNPMLGFSYDDGPSDMIMINTFWRVELKKGEHARIIYKDWPVCTDMRFDSSVDLYLVFPTEGEYKLSVFAGYVDTSGNDVIEDGPYQQTIQVTPFTPAKTSLTSYNIPSSAVTNTPTDFTVEGHVDEAGGNPVVGLLYTDGPTSEIIIDGNKIAKGKALLYGFTTVKEACTQISLTGKFTLPTAGKYTLSAIAGYIDILGNVVVYTDKKDFEVNATTPTPQTANLQGTVTESILFGLIKRPSAGATIVLDNVYQTKTASNGTYSLSSIPLGTYNVKVNKPMYSTITKTISLTEAGKTYTLDLELPINPLINLGVTLTPIAITATILTLKPKKAY